MGNDVMQPIEFYRSLHICNFNIRYVCDVSGYSEPQIKAWGEGKSKIPPEFAAWLRRAVQFFADDMPPKKECNLTRWQIDRNERHGKLYAKGYPKFMFPPSNRDNLFRLVKAAQCGMLSEPELPQINSSEVPPLMAPTKRSLHEYARKTDDGPRVVKPVSLVPVPPFKMRGGVRRFEWEENDPNGLMCRDMSSRKNKD